MNERLYNNGIEKLRIPERVQRLEISKVVYLCLENENIRSLLDIGTGSGLFAEAFSKAGIIVSGIDLNENMITAAKKYLPESDFKIAVAEDIPYEDNKFDATFFGLVFHEVSDFKKTLSEAYRVTLSQTYLLEWKYRAENIGPPIEHRLNSEFIKILSKEAGYKQIKEIQMTNFVLYQLIKST